MNPYIPVVAELGFALLTVPVLYAGFKRFGKLRTLVFFAGSILWTAPLENFAVLRGAYTYYGYTGLLYPHYPGYLVWVGLLPFWIVLGWFVFAMSGFIVFHGVLLPRSRAVVQAAASALFAVNIDLMMDPIASSNQLWIWLTGSFRLFNVPLFNFVGWFLLIFFYDLIALHTIFGSRPMVGLSRVERILFKGVRAGPDLRRFVFRIFVLETVVIVFLTLFTDFVDYIAYVVM